MILTPLEVVAGLSVASGAERDRTADPLLAKHPTTIQQNKTNKTNQRVFGPLVPCLRYKQYSQTGQQDKNLVQWVKRVTFGCAVDRAFPTPIPDRNSRISKTKNSKLLVRSMGQKPPVLTPWVKSIAHAPLAPTAEVSFLTLRGSL